MAKVMYLNYSSSLDKITEINSSFDTGILRIAYHGLNRNNSFISKENFEKNIKSMYNCPVVTNYDRNAIDENGDKGDFGSHDAHLEIESDNNGNIQSVEIVNDTYPIGVVYESAEYWWEEIEDESGIHEYLCTNVILWKRQDAYNKLKEGKIFNHSMEIDVFDGSFVDAGYYEIRDFQFTAFCILSNSIEPCFEQSSIQLFNKNNFKEEFTEMMKELKEVSIQFSKNQSSILEVDNIKENNQEGGKNVLNEQEILELLNRYNLTLEDISFSIEEMSLEEIELKIKEEFSLSDNQLRTEIDKVLQTMTEMKKNYWGELVERRSYYLMDLKDENAIVVTNSWDTYFGVPYSLNGDIVTLDFEAKVEYIPDWRPKQEGDTSVFTSIDEVITSEFEKIKQETDAKVTELTENFNVLEIQAKEIQDKLDTTTTEYSNLNTEFEALKTENTFLSDFKLQTETKQQEAFEFQQSQLKTELIENFSKVLTPEEIKSVTDKNLSLLDMETEFKLIYADKDLQTKFSKKTKKTEIETEIPIVFTKKTNNDDWTSCIKKEK